MVTSAGAPVATVTVFAVDERLAYAYATTRNSGEWDMTGLPAGRYRIYAQPEDGAAEVARVWPDEWSLCEGEVFELAEDDEVGDIDFDLPVGGSLAGTVLDDGGAPLAGVEVTCLGVDDRVAGLRREAETDEAGQFLVAGLDGGSGGSSWTVLYEADGWPALYAGAVYDQNTADLFGVTPGDAEDIGTQRLLPGITAEGRVLSASGDGGIAQAEVHAYATSQVVDTVADEDGGYVVTGLPPGDLLVWATAPGFGQTYYPSADRPGETIAALEEGEVVEGVDLFMPAESLLVGRVDDPSQDLSGVTLLAYNDTNTVGIGAQADEDGRFEVSGLHGGDYQLFLYAEDEGYLNDFVRGPDGDPLVFVVPDGWATEEARITPVPAAILAGTVIDDAGEPVYGAYVYAWSEDIEGEAEAVVTESDGTFRLDGLAAGRWGVEVFYVPYCEQDGGYVRVYWPGVVNPILSSGVTLEGGELQEDLLFELPVDGERDGMADAWEDEYGLDVGRDDSQEDPDEDGYINIDEYLLGTDPLDASDNGGIGSGCSREGKGCGGGSAWILVGLLGVRRRRRR